MLSFEVWKILPKPCGFHTIIVWWKSLQRGSAYARKADRPKSINNPGAKGAKTVALLPVIGCRCNSNQFNNINFPLPIFCSDPPHIGCSSRNICQPRINFCNIFMSCNYGHGARTCRRFKIGIAGNGTSLMFCSCELRNVTAQFQLMSLLVWNRFELLM